MEEISLSFPGQESTFQAAQGCELHKRLCLLEKTMRNTWHSSPHSVSGATCKVSHGAAKSTKLRWYQDVIDDAFDFLSLLWRCLLNVLHMQTNERVLPKRHVYLMYDVRHHFQNHTPLQFQSCQGLHWQCNGEIDLVHDFVIDVFWLQFKRKDDDRCRRCKFWMVCTCDKTHQRSFES